MTIPSQVNMTGGISGLLSYANDVTGGLFTTIFAFTIYFLFVLIIYNNQLRTRTEGDIPQAMTVAGFVTSVVMVVLAMIPDLVPTYTVLAVIGITILSAIWLWRSNDKA